jgi:hypothetical protein
MISSYKSAADRDPSGIFFGDPVEKGCLWDKGCCGLLAAGIVVFVAGLFLLGASSGNLAITVVVLGLGVVLMIAGGDDVGAAPGKSGISDDR